MVWRVSWLVRVRCSRGWRGSGARTHRAVRRCGRRRLVWNWTRPTRRWPAAPLLVITYFGLCLYCGPNCTLVTSLRSVLGRPGGARSVVGSLWSCFTCCYRYRAWCSAVAPDGARTENQRDANIPARILKLHIVWFCYLLCASSQRGCLAACTFHADMYM